MRRLLCIACLVAIVVMCFEGCGDKEKDQVMKKWETFEKDED